MRAYAWLLLAGCKGGDPGTTTPAGAAAVAPSPRVYRLTHDQWERATQDLLHLPAPSGLSAGFIGDTLSDGFENNGDALTVTAELFRDYQLAAETLTDTVLRDADLYAAVVPQDPRAPVVAEEVRVDVATDPSVTAENGAAVHGGWMLWSEGSLYVPVTLDRAGTYAITAQLWSSDCGDGTYATAEIAVEGTVVAEPVTTADPATYGGEVWLEAGEHTLRVGFTNDCYEEPDDRNLIVDWVGYEGPLDGAGEGEAGEAEAEAWIAELGLRAYRRPLTSEEQAAWLAWFQRGPELVGSGDDFADGVRLVLLAALQSPNFLYRVESSATPDATGKIPLDSWELASKLSFALWGTMPDAPLFALAAAGGLATEAQVRTQAQAMLADPRARTAVTDFHAQLLDLDRIANVVKDEEDFPLYSEALPGYLRAEAEQFVDLVVWGEGTVDDLYGAPYTVANRTLAELYGVTGPTSDDTWARVELDPALRAGLLTQAWFLASHADSTTPSIIHRGVFVNRNVLCVDIPDPPPDVTALPAPEAGQTNRERVEAHTGLGTCGAGCHATIINPPGYAFEAYDALGMFRTTDAGKPVDAAASYAFTDGSRTWSTGVEFAQLVAGHPDTHLCYATHWLEYLLARPHAAEDAALLAPVAATSAQGASVLDLLVEVVASDAFRYRKDEP